MELDYEKRLAYSPRKLEGPDRMIPPRANARWQLNFDASPREQNENVYSCLLRNELLGENIEDVKQSTPPQRLFNYHNRYNKHDPNQVCCDTLGEHYVSNNHVAQIQPQSPAEKSVFDGNSILCKSSAEQEL